MLGLFLGCFMKFAGSRTGCAMMVIRMLFGWCMVVAITVKQKPNKRRKRLERGNKSKGEWTL